MKKARMNISHSRFILFKLKIFGEIVTTICFSCGPTNRGQMQPALQRRIRKLANMCYLLIL